MGKVTACELSCGGAWEERERRDLRDCWSPPQPSPRSAGVWLTWLTMRLSGCRGA